MPATFLLEMTCCLMTITTTSSIGYDETCCAGNVCDQDRSMEFAAVFIPVLYSVALVLGLLGNGLVLAVLWKKKRTWSVTDTFILHLALADVLLLFTLPFWAVEASRGWIFGTTLCKITGAVFKMKYYCGIFLLACISVDRYVSINHGVQMYSPKKPWVVQASCLAVWFICCLLSIPDWLYLSPSYDPRRDKTECVPLYPVPQGNWRSGFRWLYHILGFLLPAAVMVLCYTRILLRLCCGSQNLQKQKDMRVIVALVIAFFISWTPYNLTLMADTLHANDSSASGNASCDTFTTLDISLTITSSLGYLHCCINPVLYAFVWMKFRRHLVEMLKRGSTLPAE
ncbi:C-X-C chemokine receptor type 3-like [Alosa sapidissima]|uniref:C-X-C chemokine receptor type 3-like n=1 Tax=Alosa sapidissima TaxID=34773 RepID=UPI001C08949F|nr:C-X-C chemokine receptor type 3-like [Alosa sapidissima]